MRPQQRTEIINLPRLNAQSVTHADDLLDDFLDAEVHPDRSSDRGNGRLRIFYLPLADELDQKLRGSGYWSRRVRKTCVEDLGETFVRDHCYATEKQKK